MLPRVLVSGSCAVEIGSLQPVYTEEYQADSSLATDRETLRERWEIQEHRVATLYPEDLRRSYLDPLVRRCYANDWMSVGES